MKVTLEREGVEKTLDTGFNILYFLFGPWLPLFQGKIGKCIKHSLLTVITLSIYYWVQCFKYNSSVIEEHMDKGWKPKTDMDRDLIKRM